MQDAYVVEANEIGNWDRIGYTGPGSTFPSGSESGVFNYNEQSNAPQWVARPKSKLNDCNTTDYWALGAAVSGENEGQGNVLYKTGAVSACTDLTPSFSKLTSGRESSGISVTVSGN